MNTRNSNSEDEFSLEKAKSQVKSDQPKQRDKNLDAKLDEADEHERNVRALKVHELQLKNEKIKNDHEDQKSNRAMRKQYATWVFQYLVCYSCVVGMMLFVSSINDVRFNISDGVLEILVGSTAVSAIGLVLAVTNGLFRGKD